MPSMERNDGYATHVPENEEGISVHIVLHTWSRPPNTEPNKDPSLHKLLETCALHSAPHAWRSTGNTWISPMP